MGANTLDPSAETVELYSFPELVGILRSATWSALAYAERLVDAATLAGLIDEEQLAYLQVILETRTGRKRRRPPERPADEPAHLRQGEG